MLGYKNRATNVKILKFHVNRDNIVYLKKCDFQRKLIGHSETAMIFMVSKQV